MHVRICNNVLMLAAMLLLPEITAVVFGVHLHFVRTLHCIVHHLDKEIQVLLT